MKFPGTQGHVDLLKVKTPGVAGAFYPADASVLRDYLAQVLTSAPHSASGVRGNADAQTVKAIIAPHAGYRYSGSIAASAYQALAPSASIVTRVILLGPAHRVGFRGIAVSDAGVFTTPLGAVSVDREGVQRALRVPGVFELSRAFANEHSLEVQLPFIQTVLPRASVVPLLVGQADEELVAAVIDELWGADETAVVISSDLSHFLDYETASERDRATSRAITALHGNRIGPDDACGRHAIKGLLALSAKKRLQGRTLDLGNSGDTAGSKDRVVGYGAYAFTEGNDLRLSLECRRRLLGVAAKAIRDRLDGIESSPSPSHKPLGALPPELTQLGACFVTLELDGALRGCIGSLEPQLPLVDDVARNAVRAAFDDPRFQALDTGEYERVDISISVLSARHLMHFNDEPSLVAQLRPEVDGLVLSGGDDERYRATFLPAVWAQLPEPASFLAQLKRKAGMAAGEWPNSMRAWRYTTQSFS